MYTNYNNYYSTNLQFGMLKKSKLTPFKRVFCETYHPPLEKMNTVDDLTKWVENSYNDMTKPHEKVGIQQALKPWKETLDDLDLARHRNSIYWKYLIYENVKRLETTYLVFPDVNAMVKTIEKTKAGLKKGIEKFNFYKLYENFLRETTIDKYLPKNKNKTGWIKITGSPDTKKQAENIKDVRALSAGTNWCTQGKLYSSIAIEDANCGMYIYVEEGKTKYGVRTIGNLTQEVRDKHNIPIELPGDALKTLQEIEPKLQIFKNSSSMLD